MKTKLHYFLSLTMFLMCSTFVFSQEKTCGMVEYMEEQMKNPEFAEEYYKNQQLFKEELRKTLKDSNLYNRNRPFVMIPVAVHFPEANEADRSCLEALAQNQVDILNADYTATNADLSNWAAASANYPGVTPGVANIYFCLATVNHPVGLDPELLEGNPAVTVGYNFGNGNDSDANWAGYMNFLVKDIGGGLLGYSPLGGSSAAGQSVVMNLGAFGSGAGCPGSGIVPGAPYNLGRTVTHELGHFYNLNHTFSGSCASDDGIADTPNISNPNYGCPSAGSVAGCVGGESALTMSYMDYTNDACMYMFSAGQTAVVDTYMNILSTQFHSDRTECTLGAQFFISAANSPYSTCTNDDVVFNINYATVDGFNEETTFTYSGNPGGTTVSFNPTSMTVDGSFTMTVGNIGGLAVGDYNIQITGTSASITKDINVTLSITDSVCVSVGNETDTYLTSTTGVIFNTISNLNNNPGGDNGYSDFTGITTDINRESSYDLTVNMNTDGNYTCISTVWIDWNQNCVFDVNEEYDLGSATNVTNGPSSNSPLSINIPTDAVLGNTTMRVTTKWNAAATACENGHDAEVEDYTVNVLASLSVDEFSLANFAVYPNPNNGEFTVKFNSATDNDILLTVFDIRGRQVYNKTFEPINSFDKTINLGNVESGVYLLQASNGLSTTTRKIVVE